MVRSQRKRENRLAAALIFTKFSFSQLRRVAPGRSATPALTEHDCKLVGEVAAVAFGVNTCWVQALQTLPLRAWFGFYVGLIAE